MEIEEEDVGFDRTQKKKQKEIRKEGTCVCVRAGVEWTEIKHIQALSRSRCVRHSGVICSCTEDLSPLLRFFKSISQKASWATLSTTLDP